MNKSAFNKIDSNNIFNVGLIQLQDNTFKNEVITLFSYYKHKQENKSNDIKSNNLEQINVNKNILNDNKDEKFNYENIFYFENEKTNETLKLLSTKREHDKISENLENKNNKGRKKKGIQNKGYHTKKSEDNIIRKIKSYFINYAHNLINKNIKNKELQLLKFDYHINEKLKKDYNLKLLNTTFRDLYEKSRISIKYKKQIIENNDKNKNIIKRIYDEDRDKEIDAINLLNMTYKELFNHFLINNLDKFLNEVYEKEKENNELEEDIVNYLEKIKQLCYKYEDWFNNKKGRNVIRKLIGNKNC